MIGILLPIRLSASVVAEEAATGFMAEAAGGVPTQRYLISRSRVGRLSYIRWGKAVLAVRRVRLLRTARMAPQPGFLPSTPSMPTQEQGEQTQMLLEVQQPTVWEV